MSEVGVRFAPSPHVETPQGPTDPSFFFAGPIGNVCTVIPSCQINSLSSIHFFQDHGSGLRARDGVTGAQPAELACRRLMRYSRWAAIRILTNPFPSPFPSPFPLVPSTIGAGVWGLSCIPKSHKAGDQRQPIANEARISCLS